MTWPSRFQGGSPSGKVTKFEHSLIMSMLLLGMNRSISVYPTDVRGKEKLFMNRLS
jgi:hypothetical protein